MATTAGTVFIESVANLPSRGQPPRDIAAAVTAAAQAMTTAEPVCTMVTLLGTGASAWYAPLPETLSFPTDHAMHLGGPPEWLWIACTLDVDGAPGETIGVLASFQRNQVCDPGLAAAQGWTLADSQLLFTYAFVTHAKDGVGRNYTRRPNVVWPPMGGSTEMSGPGAPFVVRCGPDSLEGTVDVLPLRMVIDDGGAAGAPPMLIDLTLSTAMDAGKAFFLQGVDGFTPAPRAGVYYSWPQLSVSGSVALEGKTYRVSGQGWIDHEMMFTPLPAPRGPIVDPPLGWTPTVGIFGWTFCNFNLANGDAMVVAGFQAGVMRTNLPAPYGYYLHLRDGAWVQENLAGVISMQSFLPLTGEVMLPIAWDLHLASAGADIGINVAATPWWPDGSFVAVNRSVQGETACDLLVTGLTPGGRTLGPVLGRGYCESVGYEPQPRFMVRALAYLAEVAEFGG